MAGAARALGFGFLELALEGELVEVEFIDPGHFVDLVSGEDFLIGGVETEQFDSLVDLILIFGLDFEIGVDERPVVDVEFDIVFDPTDAAVLFVKLALEADFFE